MSNHDIVGDLMVNVHHNIVCGWVIMSPLRRLDDHDYHRTRPAPRSDPAALARRTPPRHLPRLEPYDRMVRQMVGRISARSCDRLCRPLACAAPLTPADARLCGASGGHNAPDARTGYHAPDALRLDWRTCDLGTPPGVARLALAQRTDYSAHSRTAPPDPPTRRGHEYGLLSLATRLGRECHLRHRYHYQVCARWRGNPALSYHRSLLARRLLDAAQGHDQSHKLRPSAAQLGDDRAAQPASIRQRRHLLRWAHPCARVGSGRAIVSVLWDRTALHAVLRTQAQLPDRKLPQSVEQQLLVAARVHHSQRGSSGDTALLALVYAPVLSAGTGEPDSGSGTPLCDDTAAERSLAHLDPSRAGVLDGWEAAFHAQSRPQRSRRSVERSLASRPQVEWRIHSRDDQHPGADDYLLASGQRRDRLAPDQNT